MSRYFSYLNSTGKILENYKGEEPFSTFLKKYFSAHKKFGSKDRKQITHLCYCYFRLGPTYLLTSTGNETAERIIAGLFLCSGLPNEMLQTLRPEWNSKILLSIVEKLSIIGHSLQSVFPWQEDLSEKIEFPGYCQSLFNQPDLFLRIRSGYQKVVFKRIKNEATDFEMIAQETIRLPNGFKTDKYFEIDREVVIQDYSSQKVSDFFPKIECSGFLNIWDCCAGSGGKSIMAADHYKNINLFVSDKRKSILDNLKKRFKAAGINNYRCFITDLALPNAVLPDKNFDLIIADVPCTGSGTWGRTPEQLYYFESPKINEYASLQRKILSSVLPSVNKNGYFLYVTCSVFRDENEKQVEFIQKVSGYTLIRMGLMRGYELKADTMFAALFMNEL